MKRLVVRWSGALCALLTWGAVLLMGIPARADLPEFYSLTDLGTLGGTQSVGRGINTAGQVVGTANTTGNAGSQAFLYSNGTMTNIGSLLGGGSANPPASIMLGRWS